MLLTSQEIEAELGIGSRICSYLEGETDEHGYPCELFNGQMVTDDRHWDDVKAAIAAAGFLYETDADGVYLTCRD